jgi:hypothetical protein
VTKGNFSLFFLRLRQTLAESYQNCAAVALFAGGVEERKVLVCECQGRL